MTHAAKAFIAVMVAAASIPAAAGVFTNDYSWVHGTHNRHWTK